LKSQEDVITDTEADNKWLLKDAKASVVLHACNLTYSGGRGRRMESLRPTQAKLARTFSKNKRTGGVVQVTEYLLV
jgi:hypothetical protein